MGKQTVFKHVSSYIFSNLFHHILVECYMVSNNTLRFIFIIQLEIIQPNDLTAEIQGCSAPV